MKKAIISLAVLGLFLSCSQRNAEDNSPPAIFQVDIGNGPVYRSSTLIAEPMGWSDADGDKPNYRYQWMVNGAPITTATERTFSPKGLKKGDQISCVVTPTDKFSKGDPVRSNTAQLLGSTPRVLSVSIGSGPYFKGDSITATVRADDDDGDPIKLYYTWFVNGQPVAGAGRPTLEGTSLRRGDRVMVRVLATEPAASYTPINPSLAASASSEPAEVPGSPADSNLITIANTPPSSPEIVVGPTVSTAGVPIWAAVVTDSVDADGDSIHYVYDWYKNGELQDFPLTTTAVPGAYVDGGDQWVVAVSASDNYDMGWAALAPGPLVLVAAGEKLGGAHHTCMRMSTPSLVRCWGRNNYMQLGDGTTTDRIFPITLAPGGNATVNRIALGDYHTCVLLSGTTVRCWGRNDYGQLGRNNTTSPLGDTGTNVTGISGTISDLVAGSAHTCARNSAGQVFCWGANHQGQIGDGTTNNRTTAVSVIASGASAISAGAERTCIVTTVGGIKCWGRDNYQAQNFLSPTDIAASGFHTAAGSISVSGSWVCARNTNKEVKCAGSGFGATPIAVSAAVAGAGVVNSQGTQLTFSAAQSFPLGTVIMVNGQKRTIQSGTGTIWYTNASFDLPLHDASYEYFKPAQAESLVSGLSHTCMVATGTYALQCFGNNAQGQLGDGILENLNSTEFTSALGFSTNTVAVGAGLNHTCGIKGSSGSSGGVLFCWGDNTYGQLGNGSVGVKERFPTGVGGWATAIDGGNFNSCVVTEAGNVKCWGDNSFGQIGDGSTTERRIPVTVTDFDIAGNPPLSDVVALAVGGYHACALKSNGAAKCWGLNANGQLGTGNTTNYFRAKAVSGGLTFSMISAGYAHTCGIINTGGVRCWGKNTWGGLGDGSVSNRTSPVTVTLVGGRTAMSIAAGTGHTCAVDTSGNVQCWGANWSGQLGDGSNTTRTTPTVIGSFTDAVRVATHDAHTCAQTRSRNTWCWGRNAGGQLGIGNQSDATTPQQITSVNGVGESIAVGYDHTCLMTVSGSMQCWGRNKDGEVGDATTTLRSTPTNVSTLGGGVIAIAAGGSHSCAIMNGGLVKCWGRNEVGEVGNNTSASSVTTPRPNPVSPLGQGSGVSSIGAGQHHTCIVKSGVPYCWGSGGTGQIGNGADNNVYVPAAVAGGLTNVSYIRGGAQNTCARLADGTLRCWGFKNSGVPEPQGNWNGSCTSTNTPMATVMTQGGPNTWDALSGNFQHFCARNTTNNGMLCWGKNPYYQLGFGITADHCLPQHPVNVRGNTEWLRSGFVSIRGGDEHTCVMRDWTAPYPGLQRCWGRGVNGQIGDGGTSDRYNPTYSNAYNGVAIGTGAFHSCMATANGAAPWVYCWGRNDYYSLGTNNQTQYNTPAGVQGAINGQVAQVEAGYLHTCAITTAGNLYCWGWDNEYQVGLAKGAANCGPQPSTCYWNNWTGGCGCGVPAGWTCDTTDPDCNGTGACKQNTDQWGCTGCKTCNLKQSCMVNQEYCVQTATQVLPGGVAGGVSALSTRDATTCIIQSGVAKCVGRNNDGQVGNGANFTHPIGPGFNNMAGLTGTALLIASGGRVTCVKDSASGGVNASPIKCTGNNSQGQLGRNTTGASVHTPAQVLDQSLPDNGRYVSQLVAGDNHVCALIGPGGSNQGWVYCWGNNSEGQMGRGSVGGEQPRPWPVLDPYGPTVGGDDPAGTGYKVLDGIVSLGAGRNHTCAYRNSGELVCWGYNNRGQIGTGNAVSPQAWGNSPRADSDTPYAGMRGYNAELLANSTSVAAGGTHTCFIMKNGRVRCMGSNSSGQLGTGEGYDYNIPRNVNPTSLNNAIAIAAGFRHTCAIQSGGTVFCWGENLEGQLGLGDRTNRTIPTQVNISPDSAAAIYAGYSHTCVVTTGGKAKCWGRNAEGQLPSGTGIPPDLRLSPTYLQNAGLDVTGINEMALGFGHTCYRAGGAAFCVGYNGYGQIGDSNGGTTQTLPEDTSGNGTWTFTQVSVGEAHSCGVAAGAAYCWGSDEQGQLGNGTNKTRGRPTQVLGLTTGVSEVHSGAQHSCARKLDGSVWCWGDNSYGQVGRPGSFINAPVPVALGETATSLAVGAYHACAVLTSGKVQCWGSNYTGQVGAGTGNLGRTYENATYVVNSGGTHISGVSSLSAGGFHTCAVTTGAKLYCWGSNAYGQLAFDNADVGLSFGYARFVKTSSGGVDITSIAQVSAGDTHTCARRTDGTVWCWGSDLEGQIGDNATVGGNVLSPTAVSGLSAASSAVDISAGKQHTCAVRPNGSVLCWGANYDYQLGDGTIAIRQPTPQAVISLGVGTQNKVLKVTAGTYSTCAVDSVNNLRCWGDDSYGQVGVWGPRAVMQY